MADGRMLVMDDFFRFVDGCDVSDASRIVTGLLALKPPIFSVRHGAPLDGIAPAIFKHEIESRALDYRSRSERGKLAAADGENLQPAPSPKARRQAILVRQQLAQQRAQRLLEDLERVRASMPHTEREKLSAVARALNEAEIAPPSGAGRWQGTTVKRVLERAGQSTGE